MHIRSTVNALGFIVVLVLSACSSAGIQPIEISTKPVSKPELVLPETDRIQMRDVNWVIITPDNFETQVEKLVKNNKTIVFFALTDNGYESLSLNLNDLRTFIQQQQAIIVAYESYYKDSSNAIEAANAEILSNANQARLQQLNPFN